MTVFSVLDALLLLAAEPGSPGAVLPVRRGEKAWPEPKRPSRLAVALGDLKLRLAQTEQDRER